MDLSIRDQIAWLRNAELARGHVSTPNHPEALSGSPALVAQTTQVTKYPTTAASYYACHPVNVFGSEVEGQAGTTSTASGVFYAFNIGSAIPPVGTQLMTMFTGNRWTFRYDG